MIRFTLLRICAAAALALVVPVLVYAQTSVQMPVATLHYPETGAPAFDVASTLIGVIASYPWAAYVMLALTLAPWLAAVLPQAKPGSGWAAARGLLDVLAANLGNASNAGLAAPSPAMAAALGTTTGKVLLTVEQLAQTFLAGHALGSAGAPSAPIVAAIAPPPPPATTALTPTAASPIAALLGVLLLAIGLSACSPPPSGQAAPTRATVTDVTLTEAFDVALAAETAYLAVAHPPAATAQKLRNARLAALTTLNLVRGAVNRGIDPGSLLDEAKQAMDAYQAVIKATNGGA